MKILHALLAFIFGMSALIVTAVHFGVFDQLQQYAAPSLIEINVNVSTDNDTAPPPAEPTTTPTATPTATAASEPTATAQPFNHSGQFNSVPIGGQ